MGDLLFSVLSGIAIVPCFVSKIPQILSVLKTKDLRGLSFESIVLDLYCYVTVSGLSYYEATPVLNYLEYPVLLVQNTLLLILFAAFTGNYFRFTIYSTGFLILFFLFGSLPKYISTVLVGLNSPFGLASKVAQIREIRRVGRSNNVSSLGYILNGSASLARLLSLVVAGVGETVVKFNLLVSLLANLGVIVTIYLYRTTDVPRKKAE